MNHPVVAADGHTYEHDMLLEWFKRGHKTSPLTAAPLSHTTLTPNQSIRSLIIEFCEQHPEHKAPDPASLTPSTSNCTSSTGKSTDVGGSGGSSGGRVASTAHVTGTSASLASDFAAAAAAGRIQIGRRSRNEGRRGHGDADGVGGSSMGGDGAEVGGDLNGSSRRAVVLAGVHQAEVHTRRLGVSTDLRSVNSTHLAPCIHLQYFPTYSYPFLN